MRIFFGYLALIFGTPLFIASIVRSDAGAAHYIISAIIVAAGIALLYPRRWMD